MKKKIREQVLALATKITEEAMPDGRQENTFKTSSIKSLVGELYEKLSVLEYLETQLGDTPEIDEGSSLDSKSFREENWFTEPEPVPQPEHKEDIIEPLMEKIKDIVAQMPEETNRIDELLDDMLPKNDEEKPTAKRTKNDLEEFASAYQQMPEFERKSNNTFPKSTETKQASKTLTESRTKSLNDTVKKGLNIGLNDRLAFIKHLFEGQAEDYTRVLSQINTMETFEEAQSFIQKQVRPDYNNWTDKDEYSDRFMHIVEKRFN